MNSKQIGALRRNLEYITLIMLLSSISLIAKAGATRDYCSNSSAYNRSVYINIFKISEADLLELGLTGEDVLVHSNSLAGLEDRDPRLSSDDLIGLCIKGEERARNRIIHKQKSDRKRGLKPVDPKVMTYCQDVSAGSYVNYERCTKNKNSYKSASPEILNNCKNAGKTYLEIEKCVTREVRARQQKLDVKTNKTDIQSIITPVRFNGVRKKGVKANDQIVDVSCNQLTFLLRTAGIWNFKYSAESFNKQLPKFKNIKRYVEALDTQFSINNLPDYPHSRDKFIAENPTTFDDALFKEVLEISVSSVNFHFNLAGARRSNDYNADLAAQGLLGLANVAQAFCLYHKDGSAAAINYLRKK